MKSETYQAGISLLNDPRVETYFKQIECSDESFFGTLFNSVSKNHLNLGTTFVIWGNRGRPLYLNNQNLIRGNNYMFARKFSSKDLILLERLNKEA